MTVEDVFKEALSKGYIIELRGVSMNLNEAEKRITFQPRDDLYMPRPEVVPEFFVNDGDKTGGGPVG